MKGILENIIKLKFGDIIDLKNLDKKDFMTIYQYLYKQDLYNVLFSPLCAYCIGRDDLVPVIKELHKINTMVTLTHMKQRANYQVMVEAVEKYDTHYVIAKGLACSQYYPKCEQRIFGDIDFFVDDKHMASMLQDIKAMDYKQVHENSYYHYHFEHQDYLDVELHFKLESGLRFSHTEILFDRMLANARYTTIEGYRFRVPSPQDHITYLLLHGVKHLSEIGFGLRHILDIHLLIQGESIDMKALKKDLDTLGFLKAAKYVLTLSKNIFGTDVPEFLVVKKDQTYEALVDYIKDEAMVKYSGAEKLFVNSVYGRYSLEGNLKGVRRRHPLLRVLFPSTHIMPKRYAYVRKHPYLLPIAWLHRLGYECLYERDRVWDMVRNRPDKTVMNNQGKLMSELEIGRR